MSERKGSSRRRDPRIHKKKGWYYLVFYDPFRRPQRKWVALTTKYQRQADRVAVDLVDRWRADTYDPWTDESGPRTEVSVRDAIERYLASCRSHGIRRLRWKRDFLTRFADSLPDALSLDSIRSTDVEKFVFAPPARHAHYSKSPSQRSSSTLKTYRSQIKAFFDWCLAEGLMRDSPMGRVRRAKQERRQVDYWTPDQLVRMLRAIETDYQAKRERGRLHAPYPTQIIWLRDAILFLVLTALRPSEMIALRWQDVDVENGVPVRINVRAGDGRGVKTENAVRPVPLVRQASEIILTLWSDEIEPDAPVLLSPAGGPISLDTLSRGFRKYRRLARLPENVTLYNMRTTCGVLLASQGVPIRIIQKMFGHADIRTTASIYTEIYDESVRQEMDRALAPLWRVTGDAQLVGSTNDPQIGEDE